MRATKNPFSLQRSSVRLGHALRARRVRSSCTTVRWPSARRAMKTSRNGRRRPERPRGGSGRCETLAHSSGGVACATQLRDDQTIHVCNIGKQDVYIYIYIYVARFALSIMTQLLMPSDSSLKKLYRMRPGRCSGRGRGGEEETGSSVG